MDKTRNRIGTCFQALTEIKIDATVSEGSLQKQINVEQHNPGNILVGIMTKILKTFKIKHKFFCTQYRDNILTFVINFSLHYF